MHSHAHRSYPIDDATIWEMMVALLVADDIISTRVNELRVSGKMEDIIEMAKAKIVVSHVLGKLGGMIGEELSPEEQTRLREFRERYGKGKPNA